MERKVKVGRYTGMSASLSVLVPPETGRADLIAIEFFDLPLFKTFAVGGDFGRLECEARSKGLR